MRPTTSAGKRAVWYAAVFAFLLGFFAILVAAGQRGGDDFFDNLWLTLPMLAAFIAAVSSLILGLVAIVSQGERSIVVIVVTILGLLVTSFGAAEVLFPH